MNCFAYSVSFPPRKAPFFAGTTSAVDNLSTSRLCGYLFAMPNAWTTVYALVKRIPKGRVITYGQLARAVRLPGGARAAGRAMAATPRGAGVPWHRVVAAGGRIAIREPYASLQRRLLESEGTRFVERRVALADHLWKIPITRKRAAKPQKRGGRARK
ncbi:MAG TPA: methylated-DNA--[protein]-cysteine S-methyltransferase [Candidatus Acidoferrales bacterium]|nr:methylated-DNA--[protein]-cysteine S-methyltransferase [Candidatus Acidoferrales bacterium]